MDAWIDCMSYLRVDDGMTGVTVAMDEGLAIEIPDTEAFRKRVPDVFDELVE